MDIILREMGPGQLVPKFKENNIRPEDVSKLSATDLKELGVARMGCRVTLMARCEEFEKRMKDNSDSAQGIMEKVEEMKEKRKTKQQTQRANNNKGRQKTTRRIHVGWKHNYNENDAYTCMTASRGGGTHILDIPRKETLVELHERLLALFFEGGRNEAAGVEIVDIKTSFVANFSASRLPPIVGGEPFTVDKYIKKMASSPVRLYLHTTQSDSEPKNSNSETDEEDVSVKHSKKPKRPKLTQNIGQSSDSDTDDYDSITKRSENKTKQEPVAHCSYKPIDGFGDGTLDNKGLNVEQGCPAQIFDSSSDDDNRAATLKSLGRLSEEAGFLDADSSVQFNLKASSEHGFPLPPQDEYNKLFEAATATEESQEEPQDNIDETIFKNTCNETLKESIQVLAAMMQPADPNDGPFLKFDIPRHNLLQTALYRVKMLKEIPRQRLYVTFIGEPAVDSGGPSREFASLLVRDVASSSFVQGPPTGKCFQHHHNRLKDGSFKRLGQLVAICTTNGGPGLPIFCDAVAEMIVLGKVVSKPKITDIPSWEIRDALEQLQKMNLSDLRDNIDTVLPTRYELGFTLPSNRFDENSLTQLVDAVHHSSVISVSKMELDDFVEGLRTYGVHDILRGRPTEALQLFRAAGTISTKFLQELVVPTFSPEGSNRRPKEMSVFATWNLLIQAADCGFAKCNDNNLTTSDLMRWMTGSAYIPAGGFPSKVSVTFDADSSRFPRVDTCALHVTLPIRKEIMDPESGVPFLVFSIQNSEGFGNV